ncbi:hypothetical protein vseg_000099 [Gypsophila vaccaria]
MASQLFNSRSHIFNLNSLKPKDPPNYLLRSSWERSHIDGWFVCLACSVSVSPLRRTQRYAIKPTSQNLTEQQNFDQPYFTNVSNLSKNGQFCEALSVLSHMNDMGISIGPHFYVELLQGCVSDKNLCLGQQIHALIIKKGDSFVRNEYIGTKLIIFYAKCDCLKSVCKLFDRISSKNVFSWASMIGLNARLGNNDRVLAGFCEIVECGNILVDNFVVPSVFKACGANNCVGFGRCVHGYVIKMGMNLCIYVGSSLVDMYGKCGALDDAKTVLDRMIDKSVVVRNSMIVSYVQNGMYEEAIGVFYEMVCDGVEPTRVSISSFLSAAANLRALDEGRQGHALAVLYGLELGPILGSSIINFYSRVGLVEDAELVFEKMVEKDVVTWNLLVSCYVRHGLIEKAVDLCRMMRSQRLRFDCVTMASLFTSCAENRDLKLGMEGHGYCIRHGFHSDVVVVASMIDMYAKGGRLDYAKRVFDSSSEKDLVVWNTLLAAYAELGLSGEALTLFYEMQLRGFQPNVVSWNSLLSALVRNQLLDEAKHMFSRMQFVGVQPTVVTWTTLLAGLAQNGYGSEAMLLFQQMQEAGIRPNAASLTALLSTCINMTSLLVGKAIHGYIVRQWRQVYVEVQTSLVDMYAKCGSIAQAVNVFNMISDKQLAVYNAMISAYGLHSQAQEALTLYNKMSEEDIEPDDVTFTSILSACSHERLIDQGVHIFAEIISKYNRKPTLEHYGCLSTLLSRCDNLEEAMNLILTMPFEPDEQILGSILSACKERDHMELGEYISKYLFRLDPSNAANYVTLSNVYAAAGRWDKASGWRTLMKRRGLEKQPGCSWVQIGSESHVFVAGDRSHPRKDDIVTTVELLHKEMRMKHKDFSI